MDTGNFTQAHRYKKHVIEFASGAEVAKFLYAEDIMDQNIIILDTGNFTWAHSYTKRMIEFVPGASLADPIPEDVMDQKIIIFNRHWEFQPHRYDSTTGHSPKILTYVGQTPFKKLHRTFENRSKSTQK